jgi:predicted nucleic acid-binding protein
MTGERIFLDTWFIRALLSTRDSHHAAAVRLLPRIRSAAELVTSEAVIFEFCNRLASHNRAGAVEFARAIYRDTKFTVVPAGRELIETALAFYAKHADKEWGFTDCTSFLIMRERGIQLVATGDHHFRQAGFLPLMGDPS